VPDRRLLERDKILDRRAVRAERKAVRVRGLSVPGAHPDVAVLFEDPLRHTVRRERELCPETLLRRPPQHAVRGGGAEAALSLQGNAVLPGGLDADPREAQLADPRKLRANLLLPRGRILRDVPVDEHPADWLPVGQDLAPADRKTRNRLERRGRPRSGGSRAGQRGKESDQRRGESRQHAVPFPPRRRNSSTARGRATADVEPEGEAPAPELRADSPGRHSPGAQEKLACRSISGNFWTR